MITLLKDRRAQILLILAVLLFIALRSCTGTDSTSARTGVTAPVTTADTSATEALKPADSEVEAAADQPQDTAGNDSTRATATAQGAVAVPSADVGATDATQVTGTASDVVKDSASAGTGGAGQTNGADSSANSTASTVEPDHAENAGQSAASDEDNPQDAASDGAGDQASDSSSTEGDLHAAGSGKTESTLTTTTSVTKKRIKIDAFTLEPLRDTGDTSSDLQYNIGAARRGLSMFGERLQQVVDALPGAAPK